MRQKNIKLKKLKDQVIVITGASSGIGLATAKLAAKSGAKVVLAARNKQALQDAVNDITGRAGQAIGLEVDVAKLEDVIKLKDAALEAFGQIDTWVNNAGKSIFGKLMDTDLEDERELFEANFWGVRHGSRIAVPELAKRGGALINLGSEVSGASIPLQGMYSATKHAVKAFTDALRLELEKDNVPVSITLVRPAAINTPFAEHAKNELDQGVPSLPPPIYDVDVVARAILKCAEKPQRDAYIGAASRIFTVFETLAPNLSDKVIKKFMFKPQKTGRPESHPQRNESVGQVPAKEGKERGEHKPKVKKSSLYTKATVGQKKIPKDGEGRSPNV